MRKPSGSSSRVERPPEGSPSPVSRLPLAHSFESIAPTNRRDLQVQRCVPGVTTVIQQLLRSLVSGANGGDLLGLGVRLAEVGTQTALPVVKLLHVSPPLKDSGVVTPQVPRSRSEQSVEAGRTAGKRETGDGFNSGAPSGCRSTRAELPDEFRLLPVSRLPSPGSSLLRWYSPVAPI